MLKNFMLSKIVIIPTYNEIENIEAIIHAVFSLKEPFNILVVDDNSPDGTSLKVQELQEKYNNRLFLEIRNHKGGLGAAYVHGFKWTLQKNYDFIFEMDADFSHNPKDLERIYDTLTNKNADMVIGSRYSNGVNVVNWPLQRVLLSYFASIYVKLITGMKIHDATAGFVGYKKQTLQSINLSKIKSIGYAFQIEMKYRVFSKNLKIIEIPIIFTDRTKGTSKMSGSIIKEAIFEVIGLRIKKMFNKL